MTSPASASLATQYGAAGTVSYLSPSAAQDAQAIAGGAHRIRHALDCITSAESVSVCFGAIARRGGRYTGLEALDSGWVTRRAVQAGVVMAFETTGVAVDYGADSPYTRPASVEKHSFAVEAAAEMQALLDAGKVTHHPVREVKGGWEGILKGLEMLKSGKVSGQKLVVRIPQDA